MFSCRNIADFGPRLETLDNYENWIANKVTIIPFSKFESDSLYTTYFEECESLIKTLETYQSKAVTLKNYIEKRISAEQENPQQISQQSTIVP